MRVQRDRCRVWGYRFILGLMVLWFAVIAPGHKRGLIRLPGSDRPAASTTPVPAVWGGAVLSPGGMRSCCRVKSAVPPPSPPATDDRGEGETQEGPPREDPAVGCAICQLLATLDAPLVLIWPDAFRLEPLMAQIVAADQIDTLATPRHRPIRAPPPHVSC